jgi:CpXC protein
VNSELKTQNYTMPISYCEKDTLTCPFCGQDFIAEIWMLIDAAERPDLAEALREGALNVVACPHCDYSGPAGAPLLFHDPANRRVYFAAPSGGAEHEWREQAQSLLYLLVGSLPEEDRRPYLGDVQVEQEVEGVRRAVLRRQKARRGPALVPTQPAARPPSARGVEHHVVEVPPAEQMADSSPILDAVRALLAADSPEQFAAIVDERPVLLSAAADTTLAQLAEVAYAQGEREVAAALGEARAELRRMRPGAEGRESGAGELAAAPQPVPPSPRSLSDMAYQMLMAAASAEELRAAVRDHPGLLDAWADADLSERVETALDAGDERLATAIEERREALAALREELSGQAALPQALKALLQADGEDELAAALTEHPILLTDAAQAALLQLASEARQRGDDQLAEYAVECRAMLRKVREGLEAE